MKILCSLFILLCLLSCKTVEYDDYVHEPTNDIRDKLIWQQSSLKKISALTEEPVLLIPNLREFTASFHERSVKLIMCSDSKKQILITEAILINSDTGYKTSAKLDKEVILDKKGFNNGSLFTTWIYLFRENTVDYEKFENAKNLILEVYYRHHPYDKNSPMKKKVYKISLKKVKGTAWST